MKNILNSIQNASFKLVSHKISDLYFGAPSMNELTPGQGIADKHYLHMASRL